MTILNDTEKIREADPENMYNRIFDLPEQIAKALRIGNKWKFDESEFVDIKNIVIVGMGGSAIGGDLIRSFLDDKLLVPFQVVRNYTLPEYVDDETLVIVSSYSGNTEETLAGLDDALGRKAMIAAISTGGILKEIADVNQIPITLIPEGIQPRAAVGYSFIPLLVFLEKIGLIKNVAASIDNLVTHLTHTREKLIEDTPEKDNVAKQIAEKIYGKIALIYSGPTTTDVVALRWKGQICENAKNMAFHNQYSELNHNELVGWSEMVNAHYGHLMVMQLRDKDDHPQIVKRMDIVKEIISELDFEVVDIQSVGETKLERMFYLIQLGDFISYYLAVLNEVDPTPVVAIERLKDQLNK